MYGRNARSAQKLEVSLLGVANGAPSRKGCVVNGQMIKASDKLRSPPLNMPPLTPALLHPPFLVPSVVF